MPRGRWQALTRYTDDGRLTVDNKQAAHLLRSIAISRKQFLVLGSDRCSVRAASLYSLTEPEKLNGLNPALTA